MVATKDEVRAVRGAARRQQAALAGVRRWHEGALKAQAKEFSDSQSHAEATARENVRCAGLNTAQHCLHCTVRMCAVSGAICSDRWTVYTGLDEVRDCFCAIRMVWSFWLGVCRRRLRRRLTSCVGSWLHQSKHRRQLKNSEDEMVDVFVWMWNQGAAVTRCTVTAQCVGNNCWCRGNHIVSRLAIRPAAQG